jgi:hypothetical protein
MPGSVVRGPPHPPPSDHTVGGEHEADGAVEVGAVDADPLELGEHRRRRVPVVVASPDPDQRVARPDGREEPRGVRRAPMMRDLEHGGAQRRRVAQQQRLGDHLCVAGEEHAAARGGEVQHDGVLVAVEGERPVGRRREDADLGAPEGEALPGVHPLEGDAAGGGHALGLGRGQRHVRGQRRGANEQRPDGEGAQHGRQPAGVVVVGVGDDHGVERADPTLAQPREGEGRVGPAVHEEPDGAPGTVGDLDEDRVALPDVERRDGQVRDRRRREGAGQRGGDDHADEARRGEPRRPPSQQERTTEREDERRDGRRGERRGVDAAPVRRPCGSTEDPSDRRTGQRGEHAAGHRPGEADEHGDEADALGERREGHGDQVRGHRPPRHPLVERQQQQRCRPRLGTDAGRDEEAHRPRPAEALGDAGGQEQHPRRGGDGEAEAEVAGQQRVDEEQEHHRHRQGVAGVGAAAHQTRPEDEPRHHPRPQDRGLPAHQHDVPDQGRERGDPPSSRPRPEQHRSAEHPGQHQPHVASRHDDEVGEPCGGQLLPARRRLPADVAGEQPGEDGRPVGVEVCRGDVPCPLADGGGRPPDPRVGGDHLELTGRGQQRARVEAAQVRVEARAAQRASADRPVDAVPEVGQILARGQAEGGPLPHRTAVDLPDPDHRPGPVLGGARLGDDRRLDVHGAAPLGQGGHLRRRGELGPPAGQPGAEQRQPGEGEQESSPVPRSPCHGQRGEGGGREHDDAQQRGPRRSGDQAGDPQDPGEDPRADGAHRGVTRRRARPGIGRSSPRSRGPAAAGRPR